MTLFLKNLPKSFYRRIVSSRPIFDNKTSLYSTIVRPSTAPGHTNFGKFNARAICFETINKSKTKLFKKCDFHKTKCYSTKKRKTSKISAGAVTCTFEKGEIQCTIDCEQLSKGESDTKHDDLSNKEAVSHKSVENKQNTSVLFKKKVFPCKPGEKKPKSSDVEKRDSPCKIDRNRQKLHSQKKRNFPCTPGENKTKSVSLLQKDIPENKQITKICENKEHHQVRSTDVQLTGTWSSKKFKKFEFICPQEKSEYDHTTSVKSEIETKNAVKQNYSPEKAIVKRKYCTNKKNQNEDPCKKMKPASLKKETKAKEDPCNSPKGNEENTSKEESGKPCKPCSSKKNATGFSEKRNGQNTSLLVTTYSDKSYADSNKKKSETTDKLKELAESKKKKQPNNCIEAPKLDANLPKVKSQEKDLVGGSKSLIKSVCDGIFTKRNPNKSKSAPVMSKTTKEEISPMKLKTKTHKGDCNKDGDKNVIKNETKKSTEQNPVMQCVSRCKKQSNTPKDKLHTSENQRSDELKNICEKITQRAMEKTKSDSPSDQSPMMQCVALCKKKLKANTPQQGKGIPPRDKGPCSKDPDVFKKISGFNEQKNMSTKGKASDDICKGNIKEESKEQIKLFVPCMYEEIKSAIRHEDETSATEDIKEFVPCKYEEIKSAIRHEGEASADDIKQFVPCKHEEIKSAIRHEGDTSADNNIIHKKKRGKKRVRSSKCNQTKVKKSHIQSEDSNKEEDSVGKRSCPKFKNPCQAEITKNKKQSENDPCKTNTKEKTKKNVCDEE